jgi:serine O-acetyltransferase
MSQLLSHIAADLRFYHQLRNQTKRVAITSLLAIFFTSRGLWLLLIQRLVNYCYLQRDHRTIMWWPARLLAALGKYRNVVISKSEMLEDCIIKGSVYLPDSGYLICGASEIGQGTIIHDHVTFGFANRPGQDGRPVVGSKVWVGPNSIIAGPITIGDESTILPGTYLTFSVPARSVVRGNPGRIIATSFDNSQLRASLNVVTEIAQTP